MKNPSESNDLMSVMSGAPSTQRAPAARVVGRDRVPLMDPKRVYGVWGAEAERRVQDVLRSHVYVKGPHVRGFEAELAAYVGTRHAVAVDSCTDALFLVLRAVLADRPVDCRDVVLPTFTFVATAGAVVNAGGRPVFADVDVETMNLDPDSVEQRITSRTAALVPVHLFGNVCDVAALRDAVSSAQAHQNGDAPETVFFLEDAAQAIGATWQGRHAGSLADAGTFSFYPSKNLGAAGDAGIVTTDSDEIADAVRALRDHGQTRKLYDHEHIGTNSRMDEMQAAVLRAKLPHIDAWTAERRAIAERYDEALDDLDVTTKAVNRQAIADGAESAYHLYTIRVADRDAVRARLNAAGVDTGVYYPVPLHRQSCFADYQPSPCPVADRLAEEVLSLPCFPGLTESEQGRVIDALRSAL